MHDTGVAERILKNAKKNFSQKQSQNRLKRREGNYRLTKHNDEQ